MKKLLILLAFVMTLTVSYAQTDSTKYVTNSDTEKLIGKYTDKVSSAITSLAEQLKQPAEHVYKSLIKQQIINAKVTLYLTTGFFILFLCLGTIFCIKADWKDPESFLTVAGPIAFIITFIALLVFLFNFNDVVTGLLNPEYGAIKEIIEFIK